jgi:predicted aspartyl protease
MESQPVRGFTTYYNGIARVLTNKVKVQQAFDLKLPLPTVPTTEYKAIWDTGATGTAITSKVAAECGLKPTGMCRVKTASGETDTCTYFVSLYLPNMVCIPQIRVTEAVLSDADVLIGMDVIAQGDLVVTNYQSRTCMSFRMPSAECIDFRNQQPETVQTGNRVFRKVGRNELCPCGSGRKYKRCHAK